MLLKRYYLKSIAPSDHDFVEVDLGDKTVFIDSSLQDLTGFTFIQTYINETSH